MGKTGKSQKKVTYHELEETLKKEFSGFVKDFETVPTKEVAVKVYVKKLEKALSEFQSTLSLQVIIDNTEDQIAIAETLIDVWRIVIDVLDKVDQMLLPTCFYRVLLSLISRSEFQPHHLLMNNPLLSETTKPIIAKIAFEIKTLFYRTFYVMNKVMMEKQLIIFGSMEIKLKPPKKESKVKKEKEKEKKDDKKEEKKEKEKRERKDVKITVKTVQQKSPVIQTSPRENEQIDPCPSPRYIEEETEEEQHQRALLTLSEQKRMSVLSKVLVKIIEEKKIEKEDMTKKQKRLSATLKIGIGAEEQFFCENNVSPIFVQFFPEYYSYTFFQIPEFRLELLQLVRDVNGANFQLKTATNEFSRNLIKQTFPRLFLFDDMFNYVKEEDGVDITEGYANLKKTWMEVFLPKSDVFMSFFSFYIQIVYFTVKEKKDFREFGEIFGLRELVDAYIKQRLKSPEDHSTLLLKENDKRCVLMNYPFIANFMIQTMFQSTNIYDTDRCDLSITILGKWLVVLYEHGKFVTDDFCVDDIIKAIDGVVSTDHFQLIIDLMIALFDSSYFFIGNARIKLFVDTFVDKWFYTLFCHWNFYVRQAFQHIVLYKFLFTRRSHLNWARFDKWENDMIKKQSQFSVSMEEVDRKVLKSVEDKLVTIKLFTDGDINPQMEKYRIYCKPAYAEYEKALKLYNDWDKSKVQEPPKIKANLTEFDLENLE
ncbi:hypothetical protein EIN_417010 [Entamoeba invadens IP1]|uniref:Uncharacterized protein n=1 Tax=Entamoeba invadens IP1 TaxID=370355 RepID=A0A0A1TUF4_ENTIV|nr:hypothetical protein EIN_417010 [Entamoeba invadens IP1]ELP83622.1 hypothetical protein EIN_417010 [Entamoeba invadens IP1]|eukprot:XP_004182968.1 hypothetical protein EIN_417010 [Entamoeba invadens IP1]